MKAYLLLTILLTSALLDSCTSSSTAPAVTYPALYGQVKLEDSTGTPIAPPYAGIVVTASGSDTVHTDPLGNWNMASPPQGNYYLDFSKQGFGSTSFQESYILTYNSWTFWEPGLVVLTQAPDSIVRVEDAIVYDSTSPWTPLSISVTVTATSPRVFYFIDTVPNVPPTAIHLSQPTELQYHLDNEWTNADPDYIGYLGLNRGQTLYITACAASSTLMFLDSNNHEVLGNVGPMSNVYQDFIP